MLSLAPETINVRMLPGVPLAARFQLPDVAAIYFVLDALGGIQYIGKAKHLKLRWHGHHRLADFYQMSDVRIAYLVVTDASLLAGIERALIQYFDPPLNVMSRPLNADEVKKSVMVRLRLPVLRAYEEQARQQRRSLSNLLVLTLEDSLEEKDKLTTRCPTCHPAVVGGD